ncbi:MAG: glycosyltransferase family 1 protein [Gammaproteobacteria bacterium]|nr:glycosyltransferase family 1 protein [Gammaproteobacteria bacterium]
MNDTAHSLQLDIVAMAPNAWDGPWMNRQQLLSRLGTQHNIIYTNGLWIVWDRHQAAWKEAPATGSFSVQDQVLVDLSPKFLLRWPRFSAFDSLAMRMGARRWMRAYTGDKDSPRVAYLFHPQFYPYVKKIRPDFVVYHAYDMFSLTPEWNRELDEQQRELLAMADLVVASSDVIAEELATISGKTIETLPNGADFDAFYRASTGSLTEPDDLAGIAHPRIGYVGNINLKVDFPLVASMAKTHQQWNFVFVGGVGKLDAPTQKGFDDCTALKNVHFLGAKNFREIPRYASNMDVNLMCYRVEPGVWARGGYPLKLHEYLAVGKPIVSSDIPSVTPFESNVAIARTAGQWPELIAAALLGKGAGSTEERRAVAKKNSWDARVKRLNTCLTCMVNSQ